MKATNKLKRHLFFSALLFLSIHGAVLAAPSGRFACGGSVEEQVWDAWDTDMREHLEQRLLQGRLLQQGDVYALYDFQMYAQGVASMAQRCGRTRRLRDIAQLVRVAYGALETEPSSNGRRWVCRGGRTCNDKNRLLNTEVMLDSAQFLALASFTANALASSGARLDREDKAFIQDTVEVVTEHLQRWADDAAIKRLRKAAQATPDDMRNGSSSLFFTDMDLWLITLYAERAGLLRWQERRGLRDAETEDAGNGDQRRLHEHLDALLKFFAARTSLQSEDEPRRAQADIDRGYWRFYKDNRYAGYDNGQKPVVCRRAENGDGKPKMEVRVPADTVHVPRDTGWDLSHARRLVPALDALERNRRAMKSVYGLDDSDLPAKRLAAAFANKLVAAVWNGDRDKPLFSNYWSGANGWFRVAYDNGTGQCREGYPPYGMSDAFLTGGYITWARYRPVIGALGRRLYELLNSPEGEDRQFIAGFYSNLDPSANAQGRDLPRFMFLPSLVGQGRQGGATHSR